MDAGVPGRDAGVLGRDEGVRGRDEGVLGRETRTSSGHSLLQPRGTKE